MKNHYEVIIVGAGPAGLRCAEVLAKANKNVLLLEKDKIIGDKICAAGLTRKSLELMEVPELLFEYQINNATIVSSKFIHTTRAPKESVVFMIDRIEFGQWQADKLKDTTVTVLTGSKVTSIKNNEVEVNGKQNFSFDYLVGADGANSFVRRYLKVPTKNKLVTLQYKIPGKYQNSIEIHLISKYFQSGYAWVFPHRNYLTVGCSVNPNYYPVGKLKRGFEKWLKLNGHDITRAKYESFPISYDYRGYKFNKVYLIGEAAGLASGLTGEGIYQALVSGQEVAKMIIDSNYQSELMEEIIKYNRIQLKILKVFYRAGIFRESLFNMILRLFKSKYINNKISKGFS